MSRIAPFLEQYSKSSTRSGYRVGVSAFLSFIYQFTCKGKRVSDEEKEQFEILADRYFIEGRNHEADLIGFSNYCEKHFAPTTSTYYITAVKEFFIFNKVELSRRQERNLKNKIARGGPISEEENLTREMIRQLLNACDLKLKTLIMFMLTSGVRLGEAVTLTLNDIKIDPNGEYAIVSIKGRRKGGEGTKNVHSRTTFINREAVELLNQWISVREKYISYIIGRSRGRFAVKTPKNDNRIFPIGKNSAENVMRSALKRAGLYKVDPDTGRTTIHYHLFRKYFVSQMTVAEIPGKYVEFFVGHLDELDRAYNKQAVDKLLEVYLRGEPHLRIFDDGAMEIAKTKEEIRIANENMRDIRLENLEMKDKLRDFEKVQRDLVEMKAALTAIQKLDSIPLSAEDLEIVKKMVLEDLKKNAAISQ